MTRILSTDSQRHAAPQPRARAISRSRPVIDAIALASVVLLSLLFWLASGSALAQSLNPPSSMTATTYSKTQITIQWNDLNLAEGGYAIERAKGSPSGWSQAYVSGPNATSWSSTLLSPGTNYYFRARAFVVSGGQTVYSAYSPVTSATTQSTSFPDAPIGLLASVSNDTQLKLTWQNTAPNATGYRVQRLIDRASNTWNNVGEQVSSKNFFAVTGLAAQTSYTFRVLAYNGVGESAPTNEASPTTKAATTPPADTAAPSGTLTINGGAASTTNSAVTLTLSASDAAGVTGYFVSASSTPPAAGAAGWTAVASTPGYNANVGFTLAAGTGSRTVYGWYKDAAGNVSATASDSIQVDSTVTGPNPAGMTINQNATYTNSTGVTLNLGMNDAAGVTGYWVSTSTSTPAPTATGWIAVAQTAAYSANVSYTLLFTGDGNKTLNVWFKNAAGGVSQMFTDSIILDRTLPLNGTLTATPGFAQVTLNWSGFTDGGSGLATPNTYTVVSGAGSAPVNCASGTPVYSGPLNTFVHTSLTPGVTNFYRVCANDKAGNASLGATASAAGLLNVAPVAKAGPDQTGVPGASVYFDAAGSLDSDGTVVSYAYTFGDGLTHSAANAAVVTHSYAAAGTYTMTLTVTDDKGATHSDTALVTISAPTASQGNFSSVRKMGGTGIDVGYGVAIDAGGNSVVTGTFQNTIDLGGGTLMSAGAGDIYIAKYSPAGAHICSLAIGGAGDERVDAVAVDAAGNIFITGSFQGSVNFGGNTQVSAGSNDAFIAKYSSSCSATALWVRKFGSSTDDLGYGLVVDQAGDVVVTGYFSGSADFGGGVVLTNGPFADVFMVKYSGATGAYQWAHTLNGISVDAGRGAAVDPSGNVVLTGGYALTVSDETHPNLLTSAGAGDGFLIKYSSIGAFMWARSFGGVGEDVAYGIAIDKGGNIAVVGSFEGTISFNGGSQTSAGLSDSFLVKFSPMGNYLWSTRFGSSGVDIGYSIAADGVGNLVLAGAVQNNGQQDIVVSKYSAVGAPMWSRSFGGVTNDVGYGIALDSAGSVFVTGYFQSTIDFGSGPLLSSGLSDAFLLKLTP